MGAGEIIKHYHYKIINPITLETKVGKFTLQQIKDNAHHAWHRESDGFVTFTEYAAVKPAAPTKKRGNIIYYAELLSMGMTMEEIAEYKGITPDTVRKVFLHARERYNCRNNEQLLLKLIRERKIKVYGVKSSYQL